MQEVSDLKGEDSKLEQYLRSRQTKDAFLKYQIQIMYHLLSFSLTMSWIGSWDTFLSYDLSLLPCSSLTDNKGSSKQPRGHFFGFF